MPRKRIHSKRHTLRVEYAAWSAVFDTGFDFFDELPLIGIPTDNYGRPPFDSAQRAWHRHGHAYLRTHSRTDARGAPIWALKQFGEPKCLQSA